MATTPEDIWARHCRLGRTDLYAAARTLIDGIRERHRVVSSSFASLHPEAENAVVQHAFTEQSYNPARD